MEEGFRGFSSPLMVLSLYILQSRGNIESQAQKKGCRQKLWTREKGVFLVSSPATLSFYSEEQGQKEEGAGGVVVEVSKLGGRRFFSSATLPLHSAKQGQQEGQAEGGVTCRVWSVNRRFFTSPLQLHSV